MKVFNNAILCIIIVILLTNLTYSRKLKRNRDNFKNTNEWYVELNMRDEKIANEIALVVGLENKGLISVAKEIENFSHVYKFSHYLSYEELIDRKIYHKIEEEMNKIVNTERFRKYIASITPVIKKKRSVKTLDFNDPLFSEQWHLKNIGQFNGTINQDINVTKLWDEGYTGKNIVICVVDDGLEKDHPDIRGNFDEEGSWNIEKKTSDPTTKYPHGTSASGVAAAVSNNNECGTGVAYNAKLSGYYILTNEGATDEEEAHALTYKFHHNLIYSNSWGPSDDGTTVEAPGKYAKEALISGVRYGRNGLGNIYTWAGGNGKENVDNCNYDGYANSIETIAVGAVNNDGINSYYSEECAALLICAPSSGEKTGIYTIDLTGSKGYSPDSCTDDFGGTSSATPVISGVAALMLEANRNITWRDVQYILIETAYKVDPTDSDWTTNGVGKSINHKYGFGRVDAYSAVHLAESWESVQPKKILYSDEKVIEKDIDDSNPGKLYSDKITIKDQGQVEHVEINVVIDHDNSSDLEITLTSPSGTKSVLSKLHGFEIGGQVETINGGLEIKGPFAEFSAEMSNEEVQGLLYYSSENSLGCGDLLVEDYQEIIENNVVYILNERGDCDFIEKANNAQIAGFQGIIIYDNESHEEPFVMVGDGYNITIPSFMISNKEGKNLISNVNGHHSSNPLNNDFIDVKFSNSTNKPYLDDPFKPWTFMTVRNWGEDIKGDWVLTWQDLYSDNTTESSGEFISWSLNLHVINDKTLSFSYEFFSSLFESSSTTNESIIYITAIGIICLAFVGLICFVPIFLIAIKKIQAYREKKNQEEIQMDFLEDF